METPVAPFEGLGVEGIPGVAQGLPQDCLKLATVFPVLLRVNRLSAELKLDDDTPVGNPP